MGTGKSSAVGTPQPADRSDERGPDRLRFRGGPSASAVPLLVFVLATVGLVLGGSPAVEGMILASMLGISVGMLLARDPAAYSERVFSLMANRVATVAVVAWLWAGAFSGILSDSGLVEAIVWAGARLDLAGAAFTVAVFGSAALFAVSVGTGLGTVIGFTAVMYPAGIVLGAHPGALMGAILSGAAFGDNLAPISDTTIVSAATQQTDIGGVVRARLKYVALAAAGAALLFLIFGGGGGVVSAEEAERLLEDTADPTGLPMLIPAALVFLVAVRGHHFLAALTTGIVAAVAIGPLAGVFPVDRVFRLTADGSVAGSAVEGTVALFPIAILTLLLVTAIGLMEAGGFLERLLEWLETLAARSVRGAEAAIVALISVANLCVSVNTVAMITVGPLVDRLRRRHGIHSYRSANLMDTVSCSFPYALPYSATIVAAAGIHGTLTERFDFVPVLGWSEMAPYVFYGIVLFPLMIVAVATGFGREGAEDGT